MHNHIAWDESPYASHMSVNSIELHNLPAVVVDVTSGDGIICNSNTHIWGFQLVEM